MLYAVTNEIIAMRLSEGEELNRSISQICEENAIDSAVVLAAAGFVRNVTFGWFTGKEYLMETHNEIFELLSLNGDVSYKEGKLYPHIHSVMGRKDHSTVGGHILSAIVDHNLEVFIKPLQSVRLNRAFDGWFEAIVPERRS